MPATLFGRDGGAAALVGGQIVWAFGDTFITTLAADGSYYRSNTASASPRNNPTATVDALDSKGVPLPMIAFTPAEQRYNDSTGDPGNRVAVWPSHVISNPDGSGTVLYIDLYIRPGNWQGIGIGTAHLAPGSTIATRDPGFLFPYPEPSFEDGGEANGYVYLYGNLRNVSQLAYAVARAPIGQATTRSAYRFWDGSTWNADVSRAAKVVDVPGSPSLSFNAHLGTYILVQSALFSNDIVLRTAPAPQGPWSAPMTIATGIAPPSGNVDYVAREHPELSSNNGQSIVISYSRPLGNFRGEVRLMGVDFK